MTRKTIKSKVTVTFSYDEFPEAGYGMTPQGLIFPLSVIKECKNHVPAIKKKVENIPWNTRPVFVTEELLDAYQGTGEALRYEVANAVECPKKARELLAANDLSRLVRNSLHHDGFLYDLEGNIIKPAIFMDEHIWINVWAGRGYPEALNALEKILKKNKKVSNIKRRPIPYYNQDDDYCDEDLVFTYAPTDREWKKWLKDGTGVYREFFSKKKNESVMMLNKTWILENVIKFDARKFNPEKQHA